MRPLAFLLTPALLLAGCSVGDDEGPDRPAAEAISAPNALVPDPDFGRCVPPGRHLYFTPVRIRERLRITSLESGVPQTDLARPRAVETLRMWASVKPATAHAVRGTRPWPYGMGDVVTDLTAWERSFDPLALPDERPRHLQRGWHYVFVLLEGRHGGRADIRLGWETARRVPGEVTLGRGIRFDKSC